MLPTVEVESPSRLHFGLLSFGAAGRQFGGVGAMVQRPGLRLRLTPAAAFEAAGPLCSRVAEFARRWARSAALPGPPACRIEVLDAPPQHVGLGTGTQLGLSVAAGLNAACGRGAVSPVELAASVGRGRRSAVGTYGFVHGGFIVERGKNPGETLAPLDFHCDLPERWRFVLVRPTGDTGLSGPDECRVFEQLPPVPPQVTARLVDEIRLHLLPAVFDEAFDAFGESLYRFGRTAGKCFAGRQGGPFNGPLLTRLVERLRAMGVAGVGQSSWGPTLFALSADEQSAVELKARLERCADEPLEVTIAAPSNTGAQVRVVAVS